ncbi:MFS general substrate transporter [Dendrothele bispora CBS 962.96]|uniref:MFS general substrate transporter n=1 Tax=Dendrothele bispora (strain CBS 962.96) TaxID=1314807 RepID=A0A4S8KYU5_DENBC|nr:MFS general substrate transporter [Dendrothele bispora CBS 962.96]
MSTAVVTSSQERHASTALSHSPIELSLSPENNFTVFTSHQRRAVFAIICFTGLVSPLATLMYTPALPAIADNLGVSIADINLSVTVYLIFQGITPTFWGAISDVYGRRIVLVFTLSIATAVSVGLATTNSYAVLMVLRALHATGAASSRALGAGIIRDVIPPSDRGGYIGLWSASVAVGTAFGPVIGGILAQHATWHAIFFFQLAFSATAAIVVALLLPETLRSIVGNGSVAPPMLLQPPLPWLVPSQHSLDAPQQPGREFDSERTTHRTGMSRSKPDFFGSLQILRYPDAAALLIATGVFYTVWSNTMIATSSTYASVYGLSELQIGLTFIANALGAVIGDVFIGQVLDRHYKAQLKKEGKDYGSVSAIERARLKSLWFNAPLFMVSVLLFGWMTHIRAHIAAPIVFSFFIGWFDDSILSTYSTLMVDLFEGRASSSSASVNLVRCLLGAVGSSTIQLMINAMGIGWAFTALVAICLVVCMPLIAYQYTLGYRSREKRQGLWTITEADPQEGLAALPESRPESSYANVDADPENALKQEKNGQRSRVEPVSQAVKGVEHSEI